MFRSNQIVLFLPARRPFGLWLSVFFRVKWLKDDYDDDAEQVNADQNYLRFKSRNRNQKRFEGRFICYCLSHLNFRSFLFNLEILSKDCNKVLIAVFRAKPVSFQKCLWKQDRMPKDGNVKSDKRGNPRREEILAFNFSIHSLFSGITFDKVWFVFFPILVVNRYTHCQVFSNFV